MSSTISDNGVRWRRERLTSRRSAATNTLRLLTPVSGSVSDAWKAFSYCSALRRIDQAREQEFELRRFPGRERLPACEGETPKVVSLDNEPEAAPVARIAPNSELHTVPCVSVVHAAVRDGRIDLAREQLQQRPELERGL